MLIIYLTLGQVVWKMYKLQNIWEDDACGDRLSCPAWLSWEPRGDGPLRSGVVVEGAVGGTLGPGGEFQWGCIHVLVLEPANLYGAKRIKPTRQLWLDISNSRFVR